MRTTVIIPDAVVEEVRKLGGRLSLSRFVRESVEYRLRVLKREALAQEMEAGYRAEADESSLDPGWAEIETEGL